MNALCKIDLGAKSVASCELSGNAVWAAVIAWRWYVGVAAIFNLWYIHLARFWKNIGEQVGPSEIRRVYTWNYPPPHRIIWLFSLQFSSVNGRSVRVFVSSSGPFYMVQNNISDYVLPRYITTVILWRRLDNSTYIYSATDITRRLGLHYIGGIVIKWYDVFSRPCVVLTLKHSSVGCLQKSLHVYLAQYCLTC